MRPTDPFGDLSGDLQNEPSNVALIAMDRDTQDMVREWLPSMNANLIAEFEDYGPQDYDGVKEWIGDASVDVCIIDFDVDPGRAFVVAGLIQHFCPGAAIFALSEDRSPDIIIHAMRGGCREYLFKPIDHEQLRKALARVGSNRRVRTEKPKGQVLAMVGAKGGCGVTMLSTQLAMLLASRCGKKTLLLDLHPALGDTGLYLGFTSHRYHCFDLIDNTDRLDAALLQSLALHHSSGLDIVPSPQDFDSTRRIPSGVLARTLNFLRQFYDFIVIDLPASLNEDSVRVISLADAIYIVTVAEVAALRNVARIADFIQLEQVPSERVRVVLNRFEKRSPITEAQIEKVIRQKIFWLVPNQYQQAVKAITGADSSQLLRAELLSSLTGWAEALGGKAAAESAPKKKKGFLGILGGSDGD